MSVPNTVPPPQPGAGAAAKPSKWYDSTILVMVLLFFMWPVGVFALIKNRRMGGFGKLVIGGGISFMLLAVIGLSGFAGFWYYKYHTFANLPYVGKYLAKNEVADAGGDKSATPNDTASTSNPAADSNSSAPPDKPLDLKSTDTQPLDAKTLDAKPDADAQRVADEKRKLDEAIQRARELADAKAKLDAAQLEKDKADAADKERIVLAERAALAEKERVALAEKEKLALAERDRAERERLEAEQKNRSIDALAVELRDRHAILMGRKKQQAAKYETALGDYKLAADIDSDLSNLETAFKRHLMETYKNDRYDETKFNDYFTEEYLRDYNAQLKRKHAAMSQYIKTLRTSDTQVLKEEAALNAEIEAANAKLLAAGKQRIALPPPDQDIERKLKEEREAAGNLPERLVTLNDLRQRMGMNSGRRNPVADNRDLPPAKSPFDKKAPQDIADTVPLPPLQNNTRPSDPIVRPPVRLTEPRTSTPPSTPPTTRVTPAPPAIASIDLQGDWTRADGKVVWVLEAGGIMSARGPKKSQGSWVFDEKTSVLSVTHGGVFLKFTVSKDRDRDQFFMTGGAGANATLRFNKTK